MDKPSDSIVLPLDTSRRRFLGTFCWGAAAVTAGLPLAPVQADVPSAAATPPMGEIDSSWTNHLKAFHAALGQGD